MPKNIFIFKSNIIGKTLKYDFTLSTIIYGFSMSGCILCSAFVYEVSWVFINIINKTKKWWIYTTIQHAITVYPSFTLNSDLNRLLHMEQKFNVDTRINSTHLKLLNVFNAYSNFGSIHRKIEKRNSKGSRNPYRNDGNFNFCTIR